MILQEGDLICMGEAFPTRFSTTAEAIMDLNNDAKNI